MSVHPGGCLCGALRYEALAEPLRVTTCHCRFCQRATGTAYMVEPIFRRENIRVTAGSPAVYEHRSAGSGKIVHIHFCAACGTKIFMTFERFPTSCGVYAGTSDDPGRFAITPENAKHIFIGAARHDTLLPAGIPAYDEHAITNDGTPTRPVVFDAPRAAGRHQGG
ncbi:GFA family protein [Roseomonas sp. GCM10028921]